MQLLGVALCSANYDVKRLKYIPLQGREMLLSEPLDFILRVQWIVRLAKE
jgi:hypothetical protein